MVTVKIDAAGIIREYLFVCGSAAALFVSCLPEGWRVIHWG